MQRLLGVISYINDILVAGATENQHLKRLDDVLTQQERIGLHAQIKEKMSVHEAISDIPWTKSQL